MIANSLFYRVLNDRTIIVAADNTQKRTQYEEQVIRTFFVSHADATEAGDAADRHGARRRHGDSAADLSRTRPRTRSPSAPPRRSWQIVERVIEANDKPRAEVMVDVQILEVSRERAKQYGLDLGSYSAALAFSPEAAPSDDGASRSTSTRFRRASAPPTSTWRCRRPWCGSSKATRRRRCSRSRTCAARKGRSCR